MVTEKDKSSFPYWFAHWCAVFFLIFVIFIGKQIL